MGHSVACIENRERFVIGQNNCRGRYDIRLEVSKIVGFGIKSINPNRLSDFYQMFYMIDWTKIFKRLISLKFKYGGNFSKK